MPEVDNANSIYLMVTMIIAIVGTIGSGYAYLMRRTSRDADVDVKKADAAVKDADAASKLTGAALQMVDEVKEQIASLRNDYVALGTEFNNYRLETNASIEYLERENKRLREKDKQNTAALKQALARIDELERENRRLLAEKTQTRRRGNL